MPMSLSNNHTLHGTIHTNQDEEKPHKLCCTHFFELSRKKFPATTTENGAENYKNFVMRFIGYQESLILSLPNATW